MAEKDTKPNTRKYEAGTALDFNRVFKESSGKVLELDRFPSVTDLWLMFNNDAQPLQLAQALKVPIKGAKYDIVGTKGDTGQRDFVEWCLRAPHSQGGMTTPMSGVIAKMSNAMMYRFVPFVKVWKIAEDGPYKGKVVLHKLAYRPPATCNILSDDNGSFNGFRQEAYKGNKNVAVNFSPKNSLVYIHGEDWQPLVGMSPFVPVYNLYNIKKKVSFFYYAFLENVAFPRTMARVASDDPDALEYLLNKARKLSSQGIIGLYDEEKIEVYESQRNTRDYQTALEYIDWQMSKAVLGQFLDLGTSGERGSFALSKDKSSFFFDSLQAVLNEMAETINNYLIPDLVRWNFGQEAAIPKFRFRPLKDDTAGDILEIFKNVLIAPAPNITPPFILSLMQRVEEILDIDVKPLDEYTVEDIILIYETIPTAREHLESKEARAGSGQNPITGEDRNENNQTPQSQETGKKLKKSGVDIINDNIDIVPDEIPSAPKTTRRRRVIDRER